MFPTMRYIIIILYIIIKNCYTILPDEVLDIDSAPENFIDTKYIEDGILFLSIKPQSYSRIRRIVEGDVIIWESPDDRVCTDLMLNEGVNGVRLLYIEASMGFNSSVYLHYERINGSWNHVSQNRYHIQLFLMLQQRKLDINTGFTVVNPIKSTTKFGNSTTEYLTFASHRIVKLTEGEVLIWQAALGELCKRVIVHDRRGEHKCLYVELTNDDGTSVKLFAKLEANWLEISMDEYTKMNQLMSQEYSLNILSLEQPDKFQVVEHHSHGLLAFMFTSELNVHTTEVLEDNKVIWQDPDGVDKCTMAVAHLKDSKPVLLHLYIKTSEPTDGNIYYIKFDDENWIQATKEEFYNKLEEYDQKETEDTS